MVRAVGGSGRRAGADGGADGEPLLNAKGEVRTRRRWDWRKALYIAWSSVPKSKREPKTLEQFVALLGLSSSGTIRNWRAHDPGIAERIAALPKNDVDGPRGRCL